GACRARRRTATGTLECRRNREERTLVCSSTARSREARPMRDTRLLRPPRTNAERSERSGPSAPWLSRRRARGRRTGRVHRRQTEIAAEGVAVARRGLIPDIDAASGGHARGLLDRWVADGEILTHGVIAGRRKYHNAVRVADSRVRLDDVVAAHDAQAEVDGRTGRVAVTARLVPPERVVVALDSYAAAGGGCRPVPHRHVALDADG